MQIKRGITHWVIAGLISVIVIILAGLGWYYQVNEDTESSSQQMVNINQNEKKVNDNINTIININTNSSPLTLTSLTIEDTASLSLMNCIDRLVEGDSGNYGSMQDLYAGFHPEFSGIDAGSYCEFSNNMKMATYVYESPSAPNTYEQSVAIFDAEKNYVNETQNFFCPTLGDHLAPYFKSLANGILTVYCWSGDAAIGRYEEFDINLTDFSFEKTISEEGEDVLLENFIGSI